MLRLAKGEAAFERSKRKAQLVLSYRNIDFPLFRLCFLSPNVFHALNGENFTPNTQRRIHKTACAFIIQSRNIQLPRTRQLFINIVWAHYLCIVLGNTQSGLNWSQWGERVENIGFYAKNFTALKAFSSNANFQTNQKILISSFGKRRMEISTQNVCESNQKVHEKKKSFQDFCLRSKFVVYLCLMCFRMSFVDFLLWLQKNLRVFAFDVGNWNDMTWDYLRRIQFRLRAKNWVKCSSFLRCTGDDFDRKKIIWTFIITRAFSDFFQAATKEGFLMKQTWSFQRWRRRYFRLKGHKLFYAKGPDVSCLQ